MSNYFESFEEAMYAILEAFYDAFTRGGSKQSFSVHFPRDRMSINEVLDRCNSEMSNAVMSSIYGLSPERNLIVLYIEPTPIDSACIRLGKENVRLAIPICFRHCCWLPNLDDGAVLTEDEFWEMVSSLLATYSESEFKEKLEEERSALDGEDNEPVSDEYDLVFGDWGDGYYDPRYDF